MRKILVAGVALTLIAGCGESPSAPSNDAGAATETAAPSVPPPAPEPVVLRAVDVSVRGAVAGATLVKGQDGVKITTASGAGTVAVMLYLGSLSDLPTAESLRINASVEEGAVYFMSTYEGEPAKYERVTVTAKKGQSEPIILPLDKNGPKLVIIANAEGGTKSVVLVKSAELIAPPGTPAPASAPVAAPPATPKPN